MTAALVDRIRHHKAVLLALLELYEERAAILEYDGGLPRIDIERQAWAIVLAEPDRTPGRPYGGDNNGGLSIGPKTPEGYWRSRALNRSRHDEALKRRQAQEELEKIADEYRRPREERRANGTPDAPAKPTFADQSGRLHSPGAAPAKMNKNEE